MNVVVGLTPEDRSSSLMCWIIYTFSPDCCSEGCWEHSNWHRWTDPSGAQLWCSNPLPCTPHSPKGENQQGETISSSSSHTRGFPLFFRSSCDFWKWWNQRLCAGVNAVWKVQGDKIVSNTQHQESQGWRRWRRLLWIARCSCGGINLCACDLNVWYNGLVAKGCWWPCVSADIGVHLRPVTYKWGLSLVTWTMIKASTPPFSPPTALCLDQRSNSQSLWTSVLIQFRYKTMFSP